MKIWLLSFYCSSYLTICGKNQSHSEVVFYYVPYMTYCRRLQSWPWRNYSEIVTKTCLEPRKQGKYSEEALWSTLKSSHSYSSWFCFVFCGPFYMYSNCCSLFKQRCRKFIPLLYYSFFRTKNGWFSKTFSFLKSNKVFFSMIPFPPK